MADPAVGPSIGVVYSASGERYLREAEASARSSLRFNDAPHLIFCDDPPEASSAPSVEGVTYRRFDPSDNPYADKIRAMLASPFETTLYLDTDTFVCDGVGELFDLALRFDFAAARAPGYTLKETEGSAAFYDFNTGVILFRRSPVMLDCLAAWLALYREWTENPPFPEAGDRSGAADQPALRRCVWTHPVQIYVLPPEYNYRFRKPGSLSGAAKILHGRSPDFERIAAALNAERRARSFPRFTVEEGW